MKTMIEVYEECRMIGLTTDQRHFSQTLLRRSANWLSSCVTRDRRWSTAALLTLYFSLIDTESQEKAAQGHADKVRRLRAQVWEEIASRVRLPMPARAGQR